MDVIEADEATVRFQLACAHGSNPHESAFIQRSANEAARCVWCGVSQKELAELRAAMVVRAMCGFFHP